VLFLHNALGGMALVQDPAGEYDRVKGTWVIAEAEPRDLVVVAGNAGLVETLRYLSRAKVALIDVNDAPKLADSLRQDDLSQLRVLTRGRDFNNVLLHALIKETAAAGGRLILFDDFFERPWPAFDRVRALRDAATKVYDSAGAGATYVLPPPAAWRGGTQ